MKKISVKMVKHRADERQKENNNFKSLMDKETMNMTKIVRGVKALIFIS